MRFSTFGLVAFAAGVLAAPTTSQGHVTRSSHVLHERSAYHLASKWEKRDRIHAKAILPVRIGLTQRNLERGHDLLMEVSHPESPKYGQHYTVEEVTELFAPSKESVDAVRAWLVGSGIAPERISQSANKQWIQFDAKTSELEDLLKTRYHEYRHAKSGKVNVACDEYHIPAHIQEHVDYITPGIKLLAGSRPKPSVDELAKRAMDPEIEEAIQELVGLAKRKIHPESPDIIEGKAFSPTRFCDRIVTPTCLFAMYNITLPTKAAPGNELGIFEDLGDKYSQKDLDLFFLTIAKNIPQGTHPILKAIDGATAPVPVEDAGPESDLDFELAFPLVYPQKVVLFQTDDDVYENNYIYEGFLNNFLDAIDGSYCKYSAYGETGNSPLDPAYPDTQPGGYKGALQCGVYKPTNVVSISYGGQEFDLPASYQKRQCNEYLKLGLQGVSIVVASGDSGVAGPAGDDSANGCLGPKSTIFSPDFPASCPYITTLGSTYLPRGSNVTQDAERATDRFPSGGGFSNIYPIPDYQKSAVATYFKEHNPPYPYYSSVNNNSFGAHGGIYNRLGRGYPDFGALGDNVLIYAEGGPPIVIGGTSASTPIFASILNRINEERIAAGKSTVGFVNPLLYAHPEVFHDITVGSNPGCGTDGFAVTKGWDPVTGMGTPNYAKMLPLFMSQPSGHYRK